MSLIHGLVRSPALRTVHRRPLTASQVLRPLPSLQHRRTIFGIGDPLTYASLKAGKTLLWSVIGLNCAVFASWQWSFGGQTVPLATPRAQHWTANNLLKHFVLTDTDLRKGKWWTLLTSAFSHQSLNHILGNMFSLHAFSTVLIYKAVPPAALGALLFSSALAGSFGFMGKELLFRQNDNYPSNFSRSALGASGMVMGVGAAAAFLAPTTKMLLFGVVPVPMWALFAGYTFYDSFYLNNQRSNIGHAAHLAGGLCGTMFYLAFLRRLGGVFGI